MFGAGVVSLALLDGVPDFAGYEGFAIVGNGFTGEFEEAEVEFVGPEGAVGVEGGVEAGGGVDFVERAARGAHFKGEADEGGGGGVGDPAVSDARGAVAVAANFDALAQEAARRGSGDTAELVDEFAEAAFDIETEIGEVEFVGVVVDGFEDDGFGAVDVFAGEGVEFVAEFADFGAVELGVKAIAGKAGG